MIQALSVLIRARLLIARNTFWRGKIWRKLGLTAVLCLIGFAAWGLYNISRFVVAFLQQPDFARMLRIGALQNPELGLPTDITPLLYAIPSVVLFAALLLLVFSSFSSVLNSLYLSGDMDMLLVTPVPMRAVFMVKFFDGLLTQYILLFALVAPILLGYGQASDFGLTYQLATLIVLLLLPLLPAGLGALLVMAVVRIIPARRARDIVSVLGGLLGVGFYIISQLAPEVAPRLANVQTVNGLLQLDVPLLPSAWAGRAMIAAGSNDSLPLLLYGGLFVGLSLGVFIGCLLLAERLYYIGWSNIAVQVGRVRKERKPKPDSSLLSRSRTWFSVLPVQSQAVFFKDWRVFPRDLRNVQRLIFPLALAGIWTFRLLNGSEDTGYFPTPASGDSRLAAMNIWGSVGITFFLCLTLANTISGAGISREGRAFWLLKLAPISSLHILLGKLALAFLPFPLVGTLFLLLVALVQQITPTSILSGWLLLMLMGLGSTCISLGLGALFPRLDWENPQQQTTLRAGCLSLLSYSVYIGLTMAVVIGLPFLADLLTTDTDTLAVLRISLTLTGWGLALIFTLLAVAGSLFLGVRGLDRIEL